MVIGLQRKSLAFIAPSGEKCLIFMVLTCVNELLFHLPKLSKFCKTSCFTMTHETALAPSNLAHPVLLKLNNDRHEATRILSATAEQIVTVCIRDSISRSVRRGREAVCRLMPWHNSPARHASSLETTAIRERSLHPAAELSVYF